MRLKPVEYNKIERLQGPWWTSSSKSCFQKQEGLNPRIIHFRSSFLNIFSTIFQLTTSTIQGLFQIRFQLIHLIFLLYFQHTIHTNGTFYVEIKINMYKKRENKVLSKILYWDPNGSHLCAFYTEIDFSYFWCLYCTYLYLFHFFLLYVHFWYKQFCVLLHNKM